MEKGKKKKTFLVCCFLSLVFKMLVSAVISVTGK